MDSWTLTALLFLSLVLGLRAHKEWKNDRNIAMLFGGIVAIMWIVVGLRLFGIVR